MKDLNEKLVKASSAYGDQILIRAGINAIPFIGGSIDMLFSGRGQIYSMKRIKIFINELQQEISKLKEDKINKNYLESEEGYDLIIKSFDFATKTRQVDKLKIYAQIVSGAMISEREFDYDEPELYLRIIEELSTREINIAYALYELKEIKGFDIFKRKEKEYPKGIGDDSELLSNEYPEFNAEDIKPLLVRIEKTGLIKELVGSYIGYGGGIYEVNPIFKKLVDFIQFHK